MVRGKKIAGKKRPNKSRKSAGVLFFVMFGLVLFIGCIAARNLYFSGENKRLDYDESMYSGKSGTRKPNAAKHPAKYHLKDAVIAQDRVKKKVNDYDLNDRNYLNKLIGNIDHK